MTYVPPELRDRVVSRLESAIRDRDRALASLGGRAASLQGELGRVDADLARTRQLLVDQKRALAATRADLVAQEREARARLQQLERNFARQQQALQRRLADVAAEAARERTALHRSIQALATRREERDRSAREVARRALDEAQGILEGLHDVGRLDLAGRTTAHLGSLAAAGDQVSVALPEEILATSTGLLLEARELRAEVEFRSGRLARRRAAFEADADDLDALAHGAATDARPDEAASIERLLRPERDRIVALIDERVRRAAVELVEWSGHGAASRRIREARDQLAGAIAELRAALPAMVQHDDARYGLDHVWGELELRFGRILDEGAHTEGYWLDPADRKSTWRYLLKSTSGEVVIDVPWNGPLRVSHERTPKATFPARHAPSAEVAEADRFLRRVQVLERELRAPDAIREEAG